MNFARMYQAGLSLEQIARYCDTTVYFVRKEVIAEGIPFRRFCGRQLITQDIIDLAVKMRAAGMTWPELEELTGFSDKTLQRHVKRMENSDG